MEHTHMEASVTDINLLLPGIMEGYEHFSEHFRPRPIRAYISPEPSIIGTTRYYDMVPLFEFWRGDRTFIMYLNVNNWRFYERPGANIPPGSNVHAQLRQLEDMPPQTISAVYMHLRAVLVVRHLE